MILNMKELLIVADENNFAIPAFNVSNWSMFNGIVDISEKMDAPIICEIHPSELKFFGSDVITSMKQRASVSKCPMVIHLDHGSCFADCMAAIRAGFTSVMIDKSLLSFDENVAETKKVVEAAHAAVDFVKIDSPEDSRVKGNLDRTELRYGPSHYFENVSVEAEIGSMGTVDEMAGTVDLGNIHYTEPDDAVRFVKETGVDSLAVAIGTCHGDYPEGMIPELKLDRLVEIKKALRNAGLDTQLVLHGGSGNKPEELQQAARLGISKINISTDIKKPFYLTMRSVLKDMGKREPMFIEPDCIRAMEQVCAERIEWFGAEGKATLYRA